MNVVASNIDINIIADSFVFVIIFRTLLLSAYSSIGYISSYLQPYNNEAIIVKGFNNDIFKNFNNG